MSSRPDRVLLGRITGAHGIRGEVTVHSFAEMPEDIAAYGPLSDASAARSFELRVIRAGPKGVVARIKGISDRNAAEALRGTDLFVDRVCLPAAGDDAYYHADLIGLVVVSPDGAVIGKVVGIQNFGAGDLVEIALTTNSKTEWVPFSDAFVPTVDLVAGHIVVRMPTTTVADDDGETGQNE